MDMEFWETAEVRVLLLLILWFFWCIARAFLDASVKLSIDAMLNLPAIATD